MGDSIFKPYEFQISPPCPPIDNDKVVLIWAVFFYHCDRGRGGQLYFCSAEVGTAVFDQKTTFDQKSNLSSGFWRFCVEIYNSIGFKNRIPHLDFCFWSLDNFCIFLVFFIFLDFIAFWWRFLSCCSQQTCVLSATTRLKSRTVYLRKLKLI